MDKNKMHHFKLGGDGLKETSSVTKSTYDFKGNPMQIRQ